MADLRRAIGLAAFAVALLAPPPAAASVLVVGDSLGAGTEGPLRAALPGVEIDADNVPGRTSPAGIAVLGERLAPEHEAVVLDLGTNDGTSAVDVTAASLEAARGLVGDRCLVIATLNRPPVGGVPVDGQNAAILEFAFRTPNAVLVDWHDATRAVPGLLQADGVHATASGYALRGALFADALRGCLLAGGGGSGAGSDSAGAGGDPGADLPAQPASVTRVPAARRTRVSRSGPSLGRRLLDAVAAPLTRDGGPLDLVAAGVATVAAAAESASGALTSDDEEPVLGAP